MTLTIGNISPDVERRLKSAAARAGMDEAEYARLLIERSLGPTEQTGIVADPATLNLLAQWDHEDETADPGELARRHKEWEEFRKSMNENSLSNRAVYP